MGDISSLLVIGLDVASLASSAKNASYNVFSVDYFGDSDLLNSCLFGLSMIEQRANNSCGRLSCDFKPYVFPVLVEKLLKKVEVDGILLSSGLEDHPNILAALNELVPIIGNSPRTISSVRERASFFAELDRIGVSHPETEQAGNLDDAKVKARDIGYPLIVKPERCLAGYGLRKASNAKQLEKILNSIPSGEKFMIQQYIEGIAASASVMSTTSVARTLTLNEQLLGDRNLGQREPFGYSGNVVPLKLPRPIIERCKEAVERVVNHFHLVGSNGVDFVITSEGQPKVVEVNPRFQGSLECVERVLDINLVKAHIEASTSGILPSFEEPRDFCVRLILYALKRSRIPALGAPEGVRDVPFEGVFVEEGEPLCSVIAEGDNRNLALQKAMGLANSIYGSIE